MNLINYHSLAGFHVGHISPSHQCVWPSLSVDTHFFGVSYSLTANNLSKLCEEFWRLRLGRVIIELFNFEVLPQKSSAEVAERWSVGGSSSHQEILIIYRLFHIERVPVGAGYILFNTWVHDLRLIRRRKEKFRYSPFTKKKPTNFGCQVRTHSHILKAKHTTQWGKYNKSILNLWEKYTRGEETGNVEQPLMHDGLFAPIWGHFLA